MNQQPLYDRYKEIRGFAWEFLAAHEINSLPVDWRSICSRMNVEAVGYSQGVELFSVYDFGEVALANDAFSVYDEKWRIFYDDWHTTDYLPYFILHELGHILLRHPFKEKVIEAESEDGEIVEKTIFHSDFNRLEHTNLAYEQEARDLAVRVLSPACVLHALKVYDTEGISKLCGLPVIISEERAKRMERLVVKNRFGTLDEERRVMAKFQAFIANKRLV